MSTLRVNTIQNAAGSGSPDVVGTAKAWANFNGTGTVAIRASLNVSSITDNGTGNYTVNFTTAMPDANYAVLKTDDNFDIGAGLVTNSSSAQIVCRNSSFSTADSAAVSVAIFR